eukprot:CAMPEP_0205931914 /NCGR_PEP_ID=MMETSP1325-20131115/28422_1 /ASSEMBLY_ACC=CAM_ASM_000708 /TAXON_ID=236786 /ORGANISM="Florenciella sp., Strain RCC1007" /LENGTH=61 /DNA_ID=CAMNT_0053301549 /DNA_START=117 /DNA_END=299 /DNA_ORIENTATION=+
MAGAWGDTPVPRRSEVRSILDEWGLQRRQHELGRVRGLTARLSCKACDDGQHRSGRADDGE